MNMPQSTNRKPGTQKSRMLLIVWRNLPRLALLLIIVFIIALMGRIKSEKALLEKEKAATQAQQEKPINTILYELRPITMHDAINLPGAIEPWTRLELLAKVSGSITEVLVKEGSEVKEGDIIAQIESDDYRIALDSATAAYKRAQSDYERKKAMLNKKVTSEADLELSETQMLTAKAALEDAELRLSRCTIRSPMSGVIKRLDAKVGLYLSVGDPVGEILQIERLKAVVGIPESDVDAVRKLSEVDLTIKALGDMQVTGKKYFLSPAPENTAMLYRLELEVDNSNGTILPGMFFRANIRKQTIHDALAVPLYSVINRNNEQFVFVVENDQVHKRLIKLGIIDQWLVQVTEGLHPGDKVIIEGHRDVEDGQMVNVIKEITDPGGLQL